MTPADIVTAPWRESDWVFRVLPDHRVEMVHNGKVLAATTRPTNESALLYARMYADALMGCVVEHGCGGCGPVPGPYRCRRCAERDVLADRRDDEAMWA